MRSGFSRSTIARALCACLLAAAAALGLTPSVGATSSTSCQGTAWSTAENVGPGVASAGGGDILSSLNLGRGGVWRVDRDSYVSGTGEAGSEQGAGWLDTAIFGIDLRLLTVHGSAGHGSVGPYSIQKIAGLVRTIGVVEGSTDCSGSFVLVVKDDSPLTSLAGILGLILGVAGLAGVLLLALRRRGPGLGVGAGLGGAVLGLIGGAGLGLLLQQADLLAPTSRHTLLVPAAGLLLGLIAGLLGGIRSQPQRQSRYGVRRLPR